MPITDIKGLKAVLSKGEKIDAKNPSQSKSHSSHPTHSESRTQPTKQPNQHAVPSSVQQSKKRKSNANSGGVLRKKPALDEAIQAAQFRFLNERLYTSTSQDAQQLFTEDPHSFQIYHSGYQQQRAKWPMDPLKKIVTHLRRLQKTKTEGKDGSDGEEKKVVAGDSSVLKVADLGCGDGRLVDMLPNQSFVVKCFDLVAVKPYIVACDIANVPLKSKSMDAAVLSLALMGVNCNEFVAEANRILKKSGHLYVAEIGSRIAKFPRFIKLIEKMGFKCTYQKEGNYFVHAFFVKTQNCFRDNLPGLSLTPCIYKKR